MSASDKKNGFINSKYLNAATAVFVVFAVLLVCVLMFCPGAFGIRSADSHPDYEDKIFDQSMITSINIEISDEEWAAILENPTAEEYRRCNVTINGKTFYSVGIRTKGMTSLSQVANSDSDRYSFKLKADQYIQGQNFFGLEEFVINNMHQDPTYMKEYLSYDMMSYIGVPTPLFNFAEITMNGDPFGLYLAIEVMEEEFAMRVYGSDYGQLYKPESMGNIGGGIRVGENAGMQMPGNMAPVPGRQNDETAGAFPLINPGDEIGFEREERENMRQNPGGGVVFPGEGANVGENGGNIQFGGNGAFGRFGATGADLIYMDDNISNYSQIFDNAVFKTAHDSDFKRVVTALKYLNAGEDLEKYVDTDGTLRYFAANTVLVNLDSYVGSLKHNYYLYEKNGQISILPWDLNLAFGGFQGGTSSSSVNFPIDTPVTGVNLEERPLIGVLLADDAYREQYHVFLQEIINGYFNSGYYDETITRLNLMIQNSVRNDPNAFYTYEEYETAVETLRLFGELRAASIQGQLDGTIPSTYEGQQADPNALIDASDLNMDMGGMRNMGAMGGRNPDGTEADGNMRQIRIMDAAVA